jgi:WD40 repeat protein
LHDEQQLEQLEGHQDAIQAMSVLPDGTRAASIDAGGLVNLWDADRGDRVWTFRLPYDIEPRFGLRVLPKIQPRVILSPDGHTLLTLFGGNDAAKFAAWDVATHQRLSEWDGTEAAEQIDLSGDGQHLLTILGPRVSVYPTRSPARPEFDAPTYKPSRAMIVPTPSCAALSADGSSIAVGLLSAEPSPSVDPRVPGEILVYQRSR